MFQEMMIERQDMVRFLFLPPSGPPGLASGGSRMEAMCKAEPYRGYTACVGPVTRDGKEIGVTFLEVHQDGRWAYEKWDTGDVTDQMMREGWDRMIGALGE